jgi:retinol dehydrogenase 12
MGKLHVPDMTGKTVVVTGATQGIGKEAAGALAKAGARVLITARDRARGDSVVAELKAACGHDRIEVVLVDFGSLQSIRQGANEVLARTDQIHVLLNNAGAIYDSRQKSKDGLELTFAVNHLGYFLFTHLLLPTLKASAKARIVSVSSDAHKAARGGVSFDDLQREHGYTAFLVYAESKLMNILFTRELARRLQGTGVTANCLHPGVIASGFGQNTTGIFKTLVKIGAVFMTTPEKGARTSIYLCSSPEVDGVSGRYFANCKEATPTRHARDDNAARRLWELSEKLTLTDSGQAAA